MYENFWKMNRRPFENYGDEGSYYPSEVHQTALLKLRYAIEARRSLVAICGDNGMGKSMLADLLVNQLDESFTPVTRVVFPHLVGDQLLGYLTDKVTGIRGEATEPTRLTLARLETFLENNIAAENQAVVIVDEAHLLGHDSQLETLRLLLNLTGKRSDAESAMTFVLVGHSVLLSLIEQNQALDERVAEKCLLRRFTPDQSAAYLQHRLQVVGADIAQVFEPEAVDRLHARAQGIPRRLNKLADLGLMVAFAEEAPLVTVDHVEGVHQELAPSP
ncbi:MAG: AAA family ATPase [Planctomycetota bacterium]